VQADLLRNRKKIISAAIRTKKISEGVAAAENLKKKKSSIIEISCK